MSEMITVKEAARRWNKTERRVSTLCKEGRIKGASKVRKQINDKSYDAEMIREGVRTIHKYGVAFSGKQVAVTTETSVCY